MNKPERGPQYFVYQLKDEIGKTLYGFCEAADVSDVKRQLRQSGYYFISARPFKIETIFRVKVDLDQLLMFTRRLSSLIEAGIPILSAMDILWRQTEDKDMQLVISHIRRNIERGSTIAESLDHFPRMFSPMYRSLISVSERAGDFVYILKRLVSYIERQKMIVTRTKKATFYPLLVVVFAVLVLAMMFVFVVPTFQTVLVKLNVELPLLTRMIIGLSEFMRSWYFLIFTAVLAGGGWFSYRQLRRHPGFSYVIDSMKLKLPILGPIYYLTTIGRFVNSLSVLMTSGLPLVQSFDLAKKTTANQRLMSGIGEVQSEIEQGQSVYKSFKEIKIFPVLMVEMIGVGESSGSMVNSLENLTRHFDEEVDYRLNKVLTLIEPLLIIIVGGVVIVTLLAIYLPIFSIWQGLTG